MAKSRFKKIVTRTSEKARANAFIDGRGSNANYTSGARTAQSFGYTGGVGRNGRAVTEQEGMRQAWNSNSRVRTYTQSVNGKMSTDGRIAGGSTWTFTDKDADGNKLSQSGRNKLATRRQRYYDVRLGLGLAGG